MKDSGIEWIGEIPEEWEVNKYKYICEINSGEAITNEMLCDDGQYPVYGGGKVMGYYSKCNIYPNTIIIGRVGANCGCITLTSSNSWGTDNALIVSTSENTKYIYYLLISSELNKLNVSNAQPLITGNKVLNYYIPFVGGDEQQVIADFLDDKVGQIDGILSDLNKQIDILNKYKKSLITETVTKGLDSNVKMKDSGIDWIGKIPEGWKIKKLKYIISESLLYGANESGVEFDELYPRYIRITDINENNQLKEDDKLSLLPNIAKTYILKDGDILFARSGATVGKTFLYKKEYGKAAFAGYLIKASLDKKKVIPKYIYYTTLGVGYENWKNSIFTQATIQNIGADKYSIYRVPIPLLNEQKEICDFLDKKCTEIDSAISDKQKQIETMKKLKKSLIYEYVTGKKRVGGELKCQEISLESEKTFSSIS